ncbi:MAG: hypothetical protein K2M30_02825, partial [Desulfovibrionaceae bacterium]|nr:hypothetical protein [Desulfovibrionaceae bacterium]
MSSNIFFNSPSKSAIIKHVTHSIYNSSPKIFNKNVSILQNPSIPEQSNISLFQQNSIQKETDSPSNKHQSIH